MQNRYFGDVGDFGKYGLLRALCGVDTASRPALGIVWYLVPDEGHNDDGRHISYLTKPDYRACDPELHDGLRRLVIDERRARSVELLPQSGLLPATTRYFNRPLDYGRAGGTGDRRLEFRDRWLTDAMQACASCDVIFLDPDNGLEVASVPKHAPKAPKYVYWDEFEQFARLGKTLVVYHHLNRTQTAFRQIAAKKAEIRNTLPGIPGLAALLFRRGSLRVFFVLPAPEHRSLVESTLGRMVSGAWSRHFELV